jgi:hypothetical protein
MTMKYIRILMMMVMLVGWTAEGEGARTGLRL